MATELVKKPTFILQEYNNNTIEEEVMHEYDDYDDDNNPTDPFDYESEYYSDFVLELLERNRL